MIKALIVDDSKTVSQYLEYVLSQDPEIEVVGVVGDGKQAVEFVNKHRPDIITMDIDMPKMSGLEATKRIMSTRPVPIIMVTASRNANDQKVAIEALAAGALTVINKPVGFSNDNEVTKTNNLIKLIKVYAQVKVVRRVFKEDVKKTIAETIKHKPLRAYQSSLSKDCLGKKYVTIGVSSGGPKVLAEVFATISQDFPYPILVVQHITAGFLSNMVDWLNRLLTIPVRIAEKGESLLPGHVYFAPDHYQCGLRNHQIVLEHDANIRIEPSVEFMFREQAKRYASDTIAIMLTGMGRDGADAMRWLADNGALTIAQDKESSLVYGMPGEAIKLGAVQHVLSSIQISNLLYDIEVQSK